jgi:hypothetical protein
MCLHLHALACAAFFSRAARNGRTRPPAPPPDSAFQPRANATGLPGRSVGGAARRCLRQWGTESGRLLPGRGVWLWGGRITRHPIVSQPLSRFFYELEHPKCFCPADGWGVWEPPATTMVADAHRQLACSAYASPSTRRAGSGIAMEARRGCQSEAGQSGPGLWVCRGGSGYWC